jgi:hypothetical protein
MAMAIATAIAILLQLLLFSAVRYLVQVGDIAILLQLLLFSAVRYLVQVGDGREDVQEQARQHGCGHGPQEREAHGRLVCCCGCCCWR